MPKSIIDVDVNDSQFKTFLELFEKYSSTLKEMPGAWAETGEAVASVAVGFGAMTAALIEQNKLHREEDKAQAKRATAEKDAAKREHEAAAARKRAIADSAQISKNVADSALSLAKWTVLGGLGGVAAGAASLWGLADVAAWAGRERQAATGFGVSTPERQALGINFGRYFDTDSAMESLANAGMDPSKGWILNSLGINRNDDPGQQAITAALAVHRILDAVPKQNQLAIAQARGLTDVFSSDAIRRMMGETPDRLRQQQRDYAVDAPKITKISEAWQDLTTKLERAGLVIGTKFIGKLEVIEPVLEDLIMKISDIALVALDPVNFKKISDGIKEFATYVGGPKFRNDIKTITEDFGALASWIEDKLLLLGIEKPKDKALRAGYDAATAAEPSWSSNPAARIGMMIGRGWAMQHGKHVAEAGETAGRWVGDNAGGAGDWATRQGSALAAGAQTAISVADRLQRYMQAHGLSTAVSRGIAAGAFAEGGLAGAINPTSGAFGIGQWLGPRKTALFRQYGPHPDLEQQMAFLLHELMGGDRGGRAVLGATDARTALRAYIGSFMRPAPGRETSGDLQRGDGFLNRKPAAPSARVGVQVIIANQTGASVATTANAASQ